MSTLDQLISGADPTAVAYKTALESGQAGVAATLAEKLQNLNPGILLPAAYVQPGAPNNVIVTSDVVGVDDAAVT